MTDSAPPSKRMKFGFFDENIQVVVGPLRKRFNLHADILTTRSPYFKAAIAKRASTPDPPKDEQGSSQTTALQSTAKLGGDIELLDVEPEIFETYSQYLYQDTLDFDAPDDLTLDELVSVHILAAKLGDLRATNMAIDQMVKTSDKQHVVPGGSLVAIAFAGTSSESSSLRRLLVDFYMYEADKQVFTESSQLMPPAFCKAFMLRYIELKSGEGDAGFKQKISTLPACSYHQHDSSCPPCQ
ncbi:hypothetical protein LTR15_004520 [Elasticomyces elasticus]|nr:hypothetical protein LTR15_004520 [Elasticomyces elasticus]